MRICNKSKGCLHSDSRNGPGPADQKEDDAPKGIIKPDANIGSLTTGAVPRISFRIMAVVSPDAPSHGPPRNGLGVHAGKQ